MKAESFLNERLTLLNGFKEKPFWVEYFMLKTSKKAEKVICGCRALQRKGL